MNKISLYIVDGYTLSRKALKNFFENDNNFKILDDFASAKDCLSKMKKQASDIVLLELELQDISGIEAIKLIRKNYPKTKIVVFTSIKDKETILSCLANGACGYILKGIEHDIKKIINIIAQGGFWMDLQIANQIFSNLEKLKLTHNSNDLKNSLTSRELEVLELICQGKTNLEIADEIIVSKNTAKAHVGSILSKLKVKDRLQAAVIAVKANLF